MKTFMDNAGRQWTVVINVDAVRRVKGLTGVNLLDVVKGSGVAGGSGGGGTSGAGGGDLLTQLAEDPILLCDVLFAVCRPEADPRNVSDEDFGRAMAGDAIDHATTALLEELVDFFPQSKRRVLGKALRKLRTLEQRVLEVAEQRLDSPQLEAAMEAALAELDQEVPAPSIPKSSSPNSPGSSELHLVT